MPAFGNDGFGVYGFLIPPIVLQVAHAMRS
jgi:hypothetical protein